MIGHNQDNFPKTKHPVSQIHEAAMILLWGAALWFSVVLGMMYLLGVWPR